MYVRGKEREKEACGVKVVGVGNWETGNGSTRMMGMPTTENAGGGELFRDHWRNIGIPIAARNNDLTSIFLKPLRRPHKPHNNNAAQSMSPSPPLPILVPFSPPQVLHSSPQSIDED